MRNVGQGWDIFNREKLNSRTTFLPLDQSFTVEKLLLCKNKVQDLSDKFKLKKILIPFKL